MHKTFPAIILLTLVCIGDGSALFSHQSSAQSSATECPVIAVSCPDTCEANKPLTFTATVIPDKLDQEISFSWSVSKGKIKSGQATSTIEVDTTGIDPQGLTATLKVGGLSEKCNNTATCTVCIP